MGILRKIADTIKNIEAKYPGLIFLIAIIAIFTMADIFLDVAIMEVRYMWLRFYETQGIGLFSLFGGKIPEIADSVYEPTTMILSIKLQLASVLAMYVLSSMQLLKRLLYAAIWFLAIQLVGIIKYAITLSLSAAHPDNLFAVSEQPFHIILWGVPFLVGMLHHGIRFGQLVKPGSTLPAGSYYLLITRIFGLMAMVSFLRIIDESIVLLLFNDHRISLWKASANLFNAILQWPVIGGAYIVLQQFQYDVFIEGNVVSDGLTSILLGSPCLGKGVLLVFSAVILLTRTSWQKKMWCILAGLAVLILFNIARMSLLFSFVYEFGSGSYNYQTWHDIYSGIIYVAIVVLWWRCTKER